MKSGTTAEAEYVDDALVVIEQMKSIPQFSGISSDILWVE